MRDADAQHWALLTTWVDDDHARAFDESRVARAWNRSANEHLTVTMQPLVSRGKWSGQEPFAVPDTKAAPGPIAAITRARIKPQMWTKFWSAVPPVSLDLHEDPGVVFTLGIGEAPVGLQGTLQYLARCEGDLGFRLPPARARRGCASHARTQLVRRGDVHPFPGAGRDRNLRRLACIRLSA